MERFFYPQHNSLQTNKLVDKLCVSLSLRHSSSVALVLYCIPFCFNGKCWIWSAAFFRVILAGSRFNGLFSPCSGKRWAFVSVLSWTWFSCVNQLSSHTDYKHFFLRHICCVTPCHLVIVDSCLVFIFFSFLIVSNYFAPQTCWRGSAALKHVMQCHFRSLVSDLGSILPGEYLASGGNNSLSCLFAFDITKAVCLTSSGYTSLFSLSS